MQRQKIGDTDIKLAPSLVFPDKYNVLIIGDTLEAVIDAGVLLDARYGQGVFAPPAKCLDGKWATHGRVKKEVTLMRKVVIYRNTVLSDWLLADTPKLSAGLKLDLSTDMKVVEIAEDEWQEYLLNQETSRRTQAWLDEVYHAG
jgi:hypothetical protein